MQLSFIIYMCVVVFLNTRHFLFYNAFFALMKQNYFARGEKTITKFSLDKKTQILLLRNNFYTIETIKQIFIGQQIVKSLHTLHIAYKLNDTELFLYCKNDNRC